MNDLSFLSPALQALFKEYLELDTSIESGENYPEAIYLLDKYIQSIGFKTNQYPIPNGKSNRIHLVGSRVIDESLPTILLYNHIDVVPATYPDAFTFVVKNGKVWGRGVADQKGGTIALLSALENLYTKPINYNLIFWATTDEETNQLDQLRYMTDKLNLPKNTIVFDPDTFAGGITVGHLGLLQLELEVIGKSSHSGMSNLGINAIEVAAQLINEFFKPIKIQAEKTVSKLPTFPSTGVKQVCSRCNVNLIQGGSAPNVVPDICKITIDFRFIPETDVEKEKSQILNQLHIYAKNHQIQLKVTEVQCIYGNAVSHPFAENLGNTYQNISGESGYYCAMGSTPLAHWCIEQNLPQVGLGVMRGDSCIHGINENTAIIDIYQVSKTLETLLGK